MIHGYSASTVPDELSLARISRTHGLHVRSLVILQRQASLFKRLSQQNAGFLSVARAADVERV